MIQDIANYRCEYVKIRGTGIDNSLPERDKSIPWNYKLHPAIYSNEDLNVTIKYDVPKESKINISIYNLGGVPIKTVQDNIATAGFYEYIWNRSDNEQKKVEGGEYLCVMQSGMFIQIQPILIY